METGPLGNQEIQTRHLVFLVGSRHSRSKVPPHLGHPTSTGTTVNWPSLPLVVSQELRVRSEFVTTSVEKTDGAEVIAALINPVLIEPLVLAVGTSVGTWVVLPSRFDMPLGPRESVDEAVV